MGDVEAKIRAQLCAFEQQNKRAVEKEQVQERTRQVQEPNPATVFPEPYASLVASFKSLVAEHEKLLGSEDTVCIDRNTADMRTLGNALHQIGSIDLMKFTVYTYAPQTAHNYVGRSWDCVGFWRA